MGAIYSLLAQWEPSFSFALGCLEEEVQTTNLLWTSKSAHSSAGKSIVLSSHDVANIKHYHVLFCLFLHFLKTDLCAAAMQLNRHLLFPSFLFSLFLSDYLHELKLNHPILQRFYDQHIVVSHPKPALVGRVASSG